MPLLALPRAMPIYEYRCPNGHLFDLFQRMHEPSPDVCEICGAGPVEKVLHPVPVFFRGSGFYSTDYGRAKRRKDEGGDGDAPAKPDESVKKKEKEEKPKAAEA